MQQNLNLRPLALIVHSRGKNSKIGSRDLEPTLFGVVFIHWLGLAIVEDIYQI